MYGQVQQTRQTSDARFRDLVEGFMHGILIHRDFTPLFANQALAALFGYPSPETVLNLDTILRLFTPQEQAWMQQYNKDRLWGDPVPTHYEVQGVRQDGAIIWLEKTTRIVEWDGASAVQATLIDITARKQTEAALETRMGRLRMVTRLNQLVSSGLDVDAVLREIACTAATLTGAKAASCWIADDTTRTLELRAFSDESL